MMGLRWLSFYQERVEMRFFGWAVGSHLRVLLGGGGCFVDAGSTRLWLDALS
jgi:hypothetical protein